MQEMLMSTEFDPTPLNPSGKFPSATFCVFSNRLLAILVAFVACQCVHGTVKSSAPLLAFTPCSLSNTISSWSQYRALNYVTFSMQTIFKSTKVIPTMLMGTILKGTTYGIVEYLEAVAITAGVATFGLNKGSHKSAQAKGGEDDQAYEEVIGFALLCAYVLCDSFTSQWQSKLYKQYGKIDQWHMMFGVNVSSIVMTLLAIVLSGEFWLTAEFLYYNPKTLWYSILTAITSATGQVAIFTTIKLYGPIVFAIIMTTRQVFSIVLSNFIFGHTLTAGAYLGAAIVFGAVFHSVYRKHLEKLNKDKDESFPGKLAGRESKSDSGSDRDRDTSANSLSSLERERQEWEDRTPLMAPTSVKV